MCATSRRLWQISVSRAAASPARLGGRAAGAVCVLFQVVGLLLKGHELGAMLWTAVVQLVWSLPMTAALYFPCKAIARKKI